MGGPITTKSFTDGYISIITLIVGLSKQNIHHTDLLRILGLVEILENVQRFFKERTYLKKKYYLRKD